MAAASPVLAALALTAASDITSFTFRPISSPLTSLPSPSQLQCSIHTPTPPLTTTVAFTRWSPPRGHASSGTPAAAASVTERIVALELGRIERQEVEVDAADGGERREEAGEVVGLGG